MAAIRREVLEIADGRKATSFSFIGIRNWWVQLAMTLIGQLLWGLLLVGFPLLIPGLEIIGAAYYTEVAMAGLVTMLPGLLVTSLILVFAGPFVWRVMLWVMDGRATIANAFPEAFRVIKPHYWISVLILVFGIRVLGLIPLGLCAIYTAPLCCTGTGIMYRMMIGGRHPLPMSPKNPMQAS